MTAAVDEQVIKDDAGWYHRLGNHWSRWKWEGPARPNPATWRPGIPLHGRPDGQTRTQTIRPIIALLGNDMLRSCSVAGLVWCHRCHVAWRPETDHTRHHLCWLCRQPGILRYPA